MLVSDLLHSCANDRVAAAAVSSIGGEFAVRVQRMAREDNLSVGAYTSQVVRAFALGATERDWRALVFATRGHDHPVLAGLQAILDRRYRVIDGGCRPIPGSIALANTAHAA